jgi:hypothetical protein
MGSRCCCESGDTRGGSLAVGESQPLVATSAGWMNYRPPGHPLPAGTSGPRPCDCLGQGGTGSQSADLPVRSQLLLDT